MYRINPIRVEKDVFQGAQFIEKVRDYFDAIILHIQVGEIGQPSHRTWQRINLIILQRQPGQAGQLGETIRHRFNQISAQAQRVQVVAKANSLVNPLHPRIVAPQHLQVADPLNGLGYLWNDVAAQIHPL